MRIRTLHRSLSHCTLTRQACPYRVFLRSFIIAASPMPSMSMITSVPSEHMKRALMLGLTSRQVLALDGFSRRNVFIMAISLAIGAGLNIVPDWGSNSLWNLGPTRRPASPPSGAWCPASSVTSACSAALRQIQCVTNDSIFSHS